VQKKYEDMSYRIVDAIGVLGGCNLQFAYNPQDGRIVVIEINPRTSRSSALASKATGFPIARMSAKLAVGITLDELPYWKEGTLDKYTPSGDYVVVKFPRWAFEKFPQAEDKLFTQMQAVGEVMSIGKNFKEAFQKAIRSLEIKRYGLGGVKDFTQISLSEIKAKLVSPSSERIFLMYEALRKGMSVDELYQMTKINKWFISQMEELVEFEEEIKNFRGKDLPKDTLIKAKEDGFSDAYLAQLLGKTEKEIRTQRLNAGKVKAYEAVLVSGTDAAYYFSTHLSAEASAQAGNAKDSACPVREKCSSKGANMSGKRKVMILGGGPNRIGQGIEFDYTCVHAAFTLREEGIESVMVNCNPETVSTDYDTSDKLYFEPLTVEDVLSIYEKEKPEGVIVQFGGQTPLNIAKELYEAGVKILGTSPESIHLAEDRQKFKEIIQRLGIPQPESGAASSTDEALVVANKIGYPLMMRPSFVLGGRGMQVIYGEKMLLDYVKEAIEVSPEYPMLIDKFLEQALEVEVDAIADGEDVYIPTVMEHIELAGIHSGDSACVIPSRNISKENLAIIKDYTKRIAKALKVFGLMNIQYAIAPACAEASAGRDGKVYPVRDKTPQASDGCQGRPISNGVYILEANPRASRTVPIVSKVIGVSMAKMATQVMLGKELKDIIPVHKKEISHVGVKEAVFPFNMFPAVDPILGPEMKATGEVMGIDTDFGRAFYKAQLAAYMRLPQKGTVLITVADKDKPQIAAIARVFDELGFKILSTSGTRDTLQKQGIKAQSIFKLHEERPHIVDYIKNKEIDLVINTPVGKGAKYDDSYIRKAAIQYGIPYITTVAGARAAASGIKAVIEGKLELKSIQSYHKSC
jgi:carbamoyl-phosphate synthase large subunit